MELRRCTLESLGMNPAFWKNKKVLLTGHTGFKGSWLSLWLQRLGADIYGYSIDVPTQPSLFQIANVSNGMNSTMGDVRDLASLSSIMESSEPEIVIHMAAQSLVRLSYEDPVGTYDTNVMGTVNLLESVRHIDSVRVVIIVTSDKCYDNDERRQGYREEERLGGYDPYSSSKGCAELVTDAYRKSFFNCNDYATHQKAIASVRAGNVIGGGDWAQDRLIPDIVTAIQKGEPPAIRNPCAVRPWQFILDPLHGYLTLAECLWHGGSEFAGAWNFGPDESNVSDVGYLVEQLSRTWGEPGEWNHDRSGNPHEASYLKLDSSKARALLSWSPVLNLPSTIEWIVEWYKKATSGERAREVTLDQIQRFQLQAAR